MIKSFFNSVKNHLKNDRKHVPESLQLARYKLCTECPYFRYQTKQCKKCGCFVNLKTQWESEKCPTGKW